MASRTPAANTRRPAAKPPAKAKKPAATPPAPAPPDAAPAPALPESPPDAARPRWHLGFDCATKTFAFSLSRVDLDAFAAGRERIRARARAILEVARRAEALAAADPAAAARLVAEVAPAAAALDAETRDFVRIVDGETVDLFPGRADDDIPTVERLRAVARYVAARVRPAVAAAVPPGERLRVVVEFQMGPNAKARAVAAALIALFAEEDVIIVGPTLKNKVATCEAGRYCYFAERYKTSYGANKAHAKYNFARLEEAFGTGIPPTAPAALRGHIADSFMQVIGYLVHGPDEKTAALCF
jgi:hypothetical protein